MTKYRKTIIAIWLVILLIGGVLISRAQFTANLSEFLPQSPTAQQIILNEQLRHGALSRQIIISLNGGDAAIRAKLSNAFVRKLKENIAFLSVNNGNNNADSKIFNYIYSHRYLLSPTVNPALFTVAGLHNAIADSIDMMAIPGGEMTQSLLPGDPTGATIQLIRSMASETQPRNRDGVWSSRSGKSVLILVQTRASGTDMDAQQAAITAVHKTFAMVKSGMGPSAKNVFLKMSGIGVISVSSRDTIVHAAEMMSTISITLIIILLLLVYRSGIVLILGLLPVFSGVVVGISAVALGFPVIYDITLGFGTALIGEAVDYSIYFFVQSGQAADGSEEWIRKYWPTIRLGVLTSIIGFASLLFSNLPGLGQLGLYAIAGLITAATVTRLVLPTLLPRNFDARDLTRVGEHMLRLTHMLAILRPAVILLLILACVILISHRDKIWNYDLSALSPVSATEQRLYTQMRADLGVPEGGYLVVVSAPTINATLTAAEKASKALQKLEENHIIAGYETPTKYLPSVSVQQKRQASIPPRNILKKRLREALHDLPVKASLFTPFINEAELQRKLAPLTPADLHGTDLGIVVNSMLFKHDKSWDAILPIKTLASGILNPQSIRANLAHHQINHAMLIDLSDATNTLYKTYLTNAIKLSLSGVAFIALLLLLILRSMTRVFRILLPLIAAVLTVSAGFILLGYKLNILNLIGLMLIVAVGSNYALFFDRSDNTVHGEIAPRTLASLVIANVATVIGFGPLAFSGVPVLQAIGATVTPGVILALLFSASFSKPTINSS